MFATVVYCMYEFGFPETVGRVFGRRFHGPGESCFRCGWRRS